MTPRRRPSFSFSQEGLAIAVLALGAIACGGDDASAGRTDVTTDDGLIAGSTHAVTWTAVGGSVDVVLVGEDGTERVLAEGVDDDGAHEVRVPLELGVIGDASLLVRTAGATGGLDEGLAVRTAAIVGSTLIPDGVARVSLLGPGYDEEVLVADVPRLYFGPLAFEPLSRTVFYIDRDDANLVAVDLEAGTATALAYVGSPLDLQHRPAASGELIAVNLDNPGIFALDPATGDETSYHRVTTAAEPLLAVDISDAGDRVFVLDADARVRIVELATGDEVEVPDGPMSPTAIAAGLDGKVFGAVADGVFSRIVEIDLTDGTMTVRATLDGCGEVDRLVGRPEINRLLADCGAGGRYVLSASSGALVRPGRANEGSLFNGINVLAY